MPTADPHRESTVAAASMRAAWIAAGAATLQAAGMAARTMSGLKLKNVAITTSAGTGPSGAARLAKYCWSGASPSAP